jgi:hypothetical protein
MAPESRAAFTHGQYPDRGCHHCNEANERPPMARVRLRPGRVHHVRPPNWGSPAFRLDTALPILIMLDMSANHRAGNLRCVHVAAEEIPG